MTHPVTPPDGADRPSNGRSVLGPDPASTDDFGQPVDRAWPVPTRTRRRPLIWAGPLTRPGWVPTRMR